jgi:hypothetical protein
MSDTVTILVQHPDTATISGVVQQQPEKKSVGKKKCGSVKNKVSPHPHFFFSRHFFFSFVRGPVCMAGTWTTMVQHPESIDTAARRLLVPI